MSERNQNSISDSTRGLVDEMSKPSAPADEPSSENHRQQLRQLAEQPEVGLVREFWDFLRFNKKWWLIPILVCCGAITVVAIVVSSPVFPFIYTLF